MNNPKLKTLEIEIVCPECRGTGYFNGNPASVEPDECPRCLGTGKIIETKEIIDYKEVKNAKK
jgi:DnaJ-class molecular chaperone